MRLGNKQGGNAERNITSINQQTEWEIKLEANKQENYYKGK